MPVTEAKCRQASPGIALIPFEFGRLSERRANVCFGGLKRNRLFIAASQSLYALYVNTPGRLRQARPPAARPPSGPSTPCRERCEARPGFQTTCPAHTCSPGTGACMTPVVDQLRRFR
jgi:hypothetical protein